MADYIKRTDVIELARIYFTPALREEAVPVKAIRNIPSADVVEVRNGKWELAWSSNIYKCSLCKFKYRYIDNFCPNCGARMDGET